MGKSLIDTLNTTFVGFHKQNNNNLQYIKDHYETLISKVIVSVENQKV